MTFSFTKEETIGALKNFTIQRLKLLSNMKDAGREKNLPVKEYIHSLIKTIYLEEGLFEKLNENKSIDDIFNTLLQEIAKVKGTKGSDLDNYIATSYKNKKNELKQQEKALVNETKEIWDRMERITGVLEKYTPEFRKNPIFTEKHKKAYKNVVERMKVDEDNFYKIFTMSGEQHITKTFVECAFYYFSTDTETLSILLEGGRKRRRKKRTRKRRKSRRKSRRKKRRRKKRTKRRR